MNDEERVQVGQIYEVVKEMPSNWGNGGKDGGSETNGRTVLTQLVLKEGERIEIRYPYEWHFRTEDNIYLQVDEDVLLKNCKLIGKIWDNVKFENTANLEEILRLRLFTRVKNKK